MKRILPVLGLMIIMSLQACAQKNISYLRMYRSTCFGRCPSYSIEIFKNGIVRYSGYKFTDHQGVYEKNIGKANAAKWLKKFENYKPDTMKAEYENIVSDLPGINFKYEYSNKERQILNAHFGPRFLKGYALQLDSVAKVNKQWKKIADTATLSRQ